MQIIPVPEVAARAVQQAGHLTAVQPHLIRKVVHCIAASVRQRTAAAAGSAVIIRQ